MTVKKKTYNSYTKGRDSKGSPMKQGELLEVGTVMYLLRFEGEEDLWHTSAAAALKMFTEYEQTHNVSLWQKYRGSTTRIH